MESIELTEAETLEAFADALGIADVEIDQSAKTATELCEDFNKPYSTMNRYIKAAIKAGRMEAVKKHIIATDGRRLLVPAYRTVKGE